MYPAIAAGLKLEAGLSSRKGRLECRSTREAASTKPEIASDIIQEMKLV